MGLTTVDIHIDWALFLEHLASARGLVVENDVGADILHKRHLFVRTCRCDDFEPFRLGKLNDGSINP